MYNYRARMLEQFVGYDLKIWGKSFPSWMHSPLRQYYPNVYVGELEKAKAFNAAKIVINTMHYAEIGGVNLRTFEAAGCGAFQIADSRPGLGELFQPGSEIVTFETREELKDKVDYYLAHPEARRKISDAGYHRAHGEHTYVHRLQRVFRVLEGVACGRIEEPALELPIVETV
jgi:spore maturation protein CgeB